MLKKFFRWILGRRDPQPARHVHKWKFHIYCGRKQGAPESTPMSGIYYCDCGKHSVKHYGESEYHLID
jgi:hypothetical protein